MPLSAGNVVQAKTGSIGGAGAASADVTLDAATTPGTTVTVEMNGPPVWPGMPDGWDFDGAFPAGGAILWAFRLPGASNPGGQTTWTWTAVAATSWHWRVTEWDAGLDPVSPFEVTAGNNASGLGVASLSSGTTSATNRAEVVALAMFYWSYAAGADPTRVFGWGPYTGGFVERDETRNHVTAGENGAAWAWAFGSSAGATYETTATITNPNASNQDTFYAIIVVYAATVPVDPGPGVLSAGGGVP